jgi:hypothetical protein
MCENCFTTEIKSFANREAWTSFDLELTRKTEREEIKHDKFIWDGQRDKDDGEDIYQCVTCREKWRLRNFYGYAVGKNDGYFLKLSMMERMVIQLSERQKVVLGLLVIPSLIIINIIYWLWTH